MKVASFKKVITCQVGDDLAGYGAGITSEAFHDDLYMRGICMDDGTQKAVMVSFDLLGLDQDEDETIRRIFREETGIPEENVVLSCTHTHSGPHARKINRPNMFNERYVKELYGWVREAAAELAHAEFRETNIFFYGRHCPENVNRRVVAIEDNTCRGLPENKELLPIADGICDDELGVLAFFDSAKRRLTDVLVNFAAHPLASHSPYIRAGHSISADYPGFLRDFVERESGIPCTFFNGAAGDMFPKEYEQGFGAAAKLGETLGKAVLECIADGTLKGVDTAVAQALPAGLNNPMNARVEAGETVPLNTSIPESSAFLGWFPESSDLALHLGVHPLKNCVILVKGSRGIRMEKVLPVL